jgi:hypothetical protein
MSIESIRLKPSGDYLIFTRINDILVKERYSGYTVKQAKELFKEKYLTNEKTKK